MSSKKRGPAAAAAAAMAFGIGQAVHAKSPVPGKTIRPVLLLVNINAINGVIHVVDGVLEP